MNSYAKLVGEPGTTVPKSDKRTPTGVRSLASGFDPNNRPESQRQTDSLGVAFSLDAAGRTEKR
jgi:hypothetical protein